MVKQVIRITFLWDDGNDSNIYMIEAPDCDSISEIKKRIEEAHDYLCFEDEYDRYETYGRNSETLLNYLSNKCSWEWNLFIPALDIELD